MLVFSNNVRSLYSPRTMRKYGTLGYDRSVAHASISLLNSIDTRLKLLHGIPQRVIDVFLRAVVAFLPKVAPSSD